MGANPFFIRLMAGGLLRPKNTILWADIAGRVEAVSGSPGAMVGTGWLSIDRRCLTHDDKHRIFAAILRERDHLVRECLAIHGHLLHSLVYVTRILHLNLIGRRYQTGM